MVEVDLSQRNLYLDVAYGNMNSIMTGSTVKNTMTKFAQSHSDRTVLAGVNGAPWNVPAMDNSSEGASGAYGWTFGFTYANGEIYCSNDAESDFAMGISEDFVPIFGSPACDITITQGDKVAEAEYVNRMPRSDRIVVYTDRARSSGTNYAASDAYELLIDFGQDYTLTHGTNITGTITGRYGPNDSANPPALTANQMILTARGTAIADLEQFTVGQQITVNVAIYDRLGDHDRWQHARTIAGGFFPLILNGVTSDHTFNELYPATIVGNNRDGKFVMITVDGRNKNGNCKGLTGSNVHKYLLEDLDMYNALLLDGGGSATMVLNRSGTYTTVNVPTDGSDRSVKSAWILSSGPQRAVQGDVSLDSIRAGGLFLDPTHVTFESKYTAAGLVTYKNNTDWKWNSDSSLKLTSTGDDCYINFSYYNIRSKINADDYKYASIVYKLDSANSKTGGYAEMFFGADGRESEPGQAVQSGLGTTKNKWLVTTFDASSLTKWSGEVSNLRFDFFCDDRPGDVMYIHDIILGATSAEASGLASDIAATLNAPPQTTFKFNMKGHGTQIEQQIVLKGEKPVRPADPTEPGWIFEGWYTNGTLSVTYDWDSIPTKNTTVYAKWTEDPNAGASATLSFNMGGHGEAIASQTYTYGDIPAQPADPSADGWVFKGWYTSAAFTSEFNFSSPVTGDTTAFAKWVKCGDTDGDGYVNSSDVLSIMRYIVGYQINGFDAQSADFNGDGKLNNRDVLLIMLSIVDN
jgi:uncharacterized repeat protein (TIGR02543 family)